MSEEKLKILHMVEEGAISADEGVLLFNALDQDDVQEKVNPAPATASPKRPGHNVANAFQVAKT